MKRVRFVMAATAASMAAATAAAAGSSGSKAEAAATVRASIEAGLAGDMQRMREQYAPDCTFVDEFAPFLWSGPNAIENYLASGYRMYQETRHKDGKTRIGAPAYVYVSGDRAFVVEPVSGTATVGGRPYAARGAYAFTLALIEGRWRITSQTWTKSGENRDPYSTVSRSKG